MKKQIFSVLLSAAIFKTSLLFAMGKDRSEDIAGSISHIRPSPTLDLPEEKVIAHTCPSCNPEMRFKGADAMTGKGLLTILLNDNIVHILKDLPIELVLAYSTISKEMYNLCHEPSLWKHIAQRVTLKIDPKLCIKDQVLADHAYYLNLFSKWEFIGDRFHKDLITYIVRKSQFKNFVKKTCDTTWWPSDWEKNLNYIKEGYKAKPQSYSFPIGKNQFELYVANYYETVEERLEDPQSFIFRAGHKRMYNGKAFVCGEYGDFCIKKVESMIKK